jgi:hypothetical protein
MKLRLKDSFFVDSRNRNNGRGINVFNHGYRADSMVASMYLAVLVVGVLNGGAAGYLTLLIWNRQLSRHFQGRP